jgi:hypothetical protein
VASTREATLKKFGALVIGLAVITLFASSLWWAADKIKKADAINPEMWLLD